MQTSLEQCIFLLLRKKPHARISNITRLYHMIKTLSHFLIAIHLPRVSLSNAIHFCLCYIYTRRILIVSICPVMANRLIAIEHGEGRKNGSVT